MIAASAIPLATRSSVSAIPTLWRWVWSACTWRGCRTGQGARAHRRRSWDRAGRRDLADDGRRRQSLHPGFELELFQDEGEGYYLNLSSGAPVWFVMWRVDDADPSLAAPQAVSLSYNEAGRWLDAQERVDNVPLPADVRAWLQAYADENYRPEPKQRKRPASFLPPDQRK